MFSSLRDLVFTPTCIGCGALGEYVCAGCLVDISSHSTESLADLDRVIAAGVYGGWLREALIQYKNGSRRQVYGLARVLHQTVFTCADLGVVTVVPMPSTPAKIAARGFDTIHLLVRETMKLQPHPKGFLSPVLYARAGVADQVGLSAKQRERNVAHSMAARHAVSGTVVVVDDVVTTGSTMREAARALRVAGARKVFGISLCGSSKWG